MRVTESAVAMKGSSSYNHYQETTSVVTQMSVLRGKSYRSGNLMILPVDNLTEGTRMRTATISL